jgi:nitrogen fixation NifU-like protein
MSLRDLYQEMIVDHGRAPRNFGKLATANLSQVGHNPLCGDELVVYVKEMDGCVLDVQFEGAGCAISMASASLMTESIKGKSIDEINLLFDEFHQLVTVGAVPDREIGKLAVFSGVSEYPIRVKCATLAWHTLKAALNNQNNQKDEKDIVTTE